MKKLSMIHPFLFAVAPILFLFAYNMDEVPAIDLLLPLGAAVIGTLVLSLLFRFIIKNNAKSALVTSCFLILFFAYGHVKGSIASMGLTGLDIGRFHISNQFILGPLWALLFVAGALAVTKTRRDFSTLTKFLNVVATTLVIISIVNIGIYEIETVNRVPEPVNRSNNLKSGNPNNFPDIYYIIVDAYARQDTLKEVYGYDNSEFIDYLTKKGFYIAAKSCSNYPSTYLSVASSLNMDYLREEEQKSKTTMLEMIGNSKVSQFLKDKGYRYIFAGGGLDWKGINRYTDDYLVYRSGSLFRKSDFVDSLISTTALSPFAVFSQGFFGDSDRKARLYAFEKLAEIPSIAEPTFVYAHIYSPHPPFIFDRDGNPPKRSIWQGMGNIWQSSVNKESYIDQLVFVNKKIETLVEAILLKSDRAPVIILQADHGIWWEKGREKAILNAYYIPDKESLYQTISPVNSFRIVFNLYFGTDYELLTDESYLGWPPNLSVVPSENGAN